MAKRVMTQAAQLLLEQALQLGPEERAALADSLYESFHPPMDPEVAAAWVKEAETRLAEYEAGTVQTSSVDEVFKRIEKRHKR